MHCFVRGLIAFRKSNSVVARSGFWRDDVRWYGVGAQPDLSWNSHAFAFCLHDDAGPQLYVMVNAYWEPLTFALQEGAPSMWQLFVDTSLEAPHDLVEDASAPALDSASCVVGARSVVVLTRAASQTPPG